MIANPGNHSKIHPQKFGLYLGIVSLIMAFAGLSSAYIVRQSAGNWLEFRLPTMFFVSTGVIVLSSLFVWLSSRAFNQQKELAYKTYMVGAFVMGCAFIVTQYLGWMQMYSSGIDLKGNPSGSFVYVMTILHVFHVLGGLVVLTVALYHAFVLPFELTYKRRVRLDLTSIYWHFVDILWIYLLLFFILQR
ncbi:cytochrome c oxidase subunit 3 [Membranicola marinus]|uniref:Cytochrome c oxidase subunit 3 n=2 Tax=Membranihabitans marinus TaxID=1227546 RepID=A0A953HPT4_9BACT|nr:cytochrome c oxidase subunit 3 [Membranihabitans marinus]